MSSQTAFVSYVGKLCRPPLKGEKKWPFVGELHHVTGISDEEDGIYVVPISDNFRSRLALIASNEAQKVEGTLPDHYKCSFPSYGTHEVKTRPCPLKTVPAVRKAILHSLRTTYPDMRFELA